MSRVVEGSPDALLAAARVLAAQGSAVQGRAERLGAAARVSGWEGSAALAYATRAQQLRRTLTTEADHLGGLARSTAAYAVRLRAAQQQATLLQGRRDRARVQLQRLEQTPCQRVVDPANEARRLSLAEEVAILQGRLDALADGAGLDARTLARALAFDPTTLLPGWALGALAVKGAVLGGRGAVTRGRQVGSLTREVAKARWVLAGGNVTEWLAHLEKADGVLEELRGGKADPSGWLVRHLPTRAGGLLVESQRAAAKAFLPLTVKDGVVDVVTGGGYHDWREPVTRVMGGVGAASAATLIVASGGTLAVVAGAGLLAYTAWKLGNAVWDHRREIAAFGRSTWRVVLRGLELRGRVQTWAARRAVDTVRAAGRLRQTMADRVGDGVGRALRSIHLPRPPLPSFGF